MTDLDTLLAEARLNDRRLIIYLLVDTSSSMKAGGAIDAANDYLQRFKTELLDPSPFRDRIHVGLITFGAESMLAGEHLVPADQFEPPMLTAGRSRRLNLAFRTLQHSLNQNARRPNTANAGDGQPVAFFFTDGRLTPTERRQTSPWIAARDAVLKAGLRDIWVVGCGTSADKPGLREVGTHYSVLLTASGAPWSSLVDMDSLIRDSLTRGIGPLSADTDRDRPSTMYSSMPDFEPYPASSAAPSEAMHGDMQSDADVDYESIQVLAQTIMAEPLNSPSLPLSRMPEEYPKQSQIPEPTHFSLRYPKEVAAATWSPLYGYVFRESAELAVRADAQRLFDTGLSETREKSKPSHRVIPEGTSITATPSIEGCEFNPPSMTLGFYEPWHRFDFRLRAGEAMEGRGLNGFVTFTVTGIILAEIPVSIYVGEKTSELHTSPQLHAPYERLFVSYSHLDSKIVDRIEHAYRALGLDCLKDAIVLRSGDAWERKLLGLIEESDIFQLFWSKNAAQSDYVGREWRHAIQVGRDGARFIRPVYWTKPMAPAPEELKHLHFVYNPDLAVGSGS